MQRMFHLFLTSYLATFATAQDVTTFEFEVQSLGGQTLRHQDFEKSILIVDFWGTWCPPCKEVAPVLQRLYGKYKHHGLEIVGFNYEGAAKDAEAKVRTFATEHGLTYHLAMGSPALKRQVPNFSGYPTMLMFGRGLAFEKRSVGLLDAQETHDLENWVRSQAGLPKLERGDVIEVEEGDAAIEKENNEAEAEPEPLDLPSGVVFMPGDGDKGFDFEAEDDAGKKLKFKEMRGKPVVIALTSTWDASADLTAAALSKIHTRFADGAHVVAASLELRGSRERKVSKIKAFREKHSLGYSIFPAGIGFQKKVHQFSGMPMFLVFDPDGVLVLRESGTDQDADEGKELDGVIEKVESTLATFAAGNGNGTDKK